MSDNAIKFNLNSKLYPIVVTQMIKEQELDDVYISKNAIFRGIEYKENMMVAYSKTEFGQYNLCQIKYVTIDSNFENISFIGKRVIAMYCDTTGLLYRPNSFENYIHVNYCQVINVETVLQCEQENEAIFSFKSAPFEVY